MLLILYMMFFQDYPYFFNGTADFHFSQKQLITADNLYMKTKHK